MPVASMGHLPLVLVTAGLPLDFLRPRYADNGVFIMIFFPDSGIQKSTYSFFLTAFR
jgi:hypothetical protein